ncbi:MAG: transcriptional repressor [Frankia sp.]|nr:transcriptional repressor [Frankia sp.]
MTARPLPPQVADQPRQPAPDTTDAVRTDRHTARFDREGWQERLRAHGYRLTAQRQLVLEAVARLGHATPEAIVNEVRRTASAVNISTVYRTLDLLEELDLVSHAHLGHGAPTYHVTGPDRHIHLVCGGCGTVSEISQDRLSGVVEALRADFGFTVDVDHVALAGRCADCSARAGG